MVLLKGEEINVVSGERTRTYVLFALFIQQSGRIMNDTAVKFALLSY